MRRRSWKLPFALGALLVLLALAWLSVAFVRLEGRARIEAERGEAVRLALWRMDSWWTASLAVEAARAPERFLEELSAGDVAAPWRALAFEYSRESAPELRGWRAVPAGPAATALREDLPREGIAAALERLERELPGWEAGDLEDVPLGAPGAEAEGEGLAAGAAEQQRARSRKEQALRSKLAYESQWVANNSRMAEPEAAERVGPWAALWLADGERLAYARRVGGGSGARVQGFLVDWPVLRGELEEQVRDLLPGARLEPVREGAPPARQDDRGGERLATLPAHLLAGPPASLPPPSGAARTTLLVSWAFALLALSAVGASLRGSALLAERRRRFASTVTHELRTPLTTFRLYSDMLARDMVPAERRAEYLATLCSESDRLARLVENVLAYARVEEGRHAPRRTELGVRELLEGLLPALEAQALGAGVLFEWELPEEAGAQRIATDPDGVAQVLSNLLENAARYGRDARGEVHARLDVRTEGGRLVLRLGDGGPGVPDGERERVFEPFERGSRGREQPNAGVGLGLALSRGVARVLGGELRLAPAERGAAFELVLPL